MTSLIVTGAAGRMGKEIILQISQAQNAKLVGATEYAGSKAIGQDAGVLSGGSANGVLIQASLAEALKQNPTNAAVIDFSATESTLKNASELAKAKIPLVIGTTGFNPKQLSEIQSAAKSIPIVMAPNMSVGVNTLFKLIKDAAVALGSGYDLEVFEAHHRLKKDAPSGTAVRIAQILAEATGREYPKDANFHREGLTGERNPKEIGMQVLRGGDIVGEHTVFYCGEGERLEIKHVATHRKTFAQGAIRAALWLSGKKPGLYDMQDVLGFK